MDGLENSYYNSQTGLPNREFRPRRPHTKSKNGCIQCKNRRIKCDELSPRCTRCEKGGLICKYPEFMSHSPRGGSDSSSTVPGTASNPRTPGTPHGSNLVHPFGQLALSTCSSPTSILCPVVPAPPGLPSDHVQLFDHYTRHTNRAVNFDEADSYAIQVGIPTLTRDCPALQATVLSVAATCSCVDIISHPAPIPGDRDRVIHLLAQSNRHHLRSVQTMQTVIAAGGPQPDQHYDHVLANAWLMAVYGTASHRLRIWLANTQPAGQPPLPEEFQPNQSGWISLFHTVHAVYVSIGNQDNRQPEQQSHSRETSLPISEGRNSLPASTNTPALGPFTEEVISPHQPPMHISNHALYSVLVSTSPTAITTLKERAQTLTTTLSTSESLDLLITSLTAIDILSGVVAQVVATSHPSSDTPPTNTPLHLSTPYTSSQEPFQFDFNTPRGRFSDLSPWLKTYLARALAVTPSRPFRRIVFSFLYRVPNTYLDSVRRVLDSFPLVMTSTSQSTTQSEDRNGLLQETLEQRELWMVDALVIDIFAHWLSFTLMMDGVWFFGDVGYWELGRIVKMVEQNRIKVAGVEAVEKGKGRAEGVDNVGEEEEAEWWPGKIYRVAGETRDH